MDNIENTFGSLASGKFEGFGGWAGNIRREGLLVRTVQAADQYSSEWLIQAPRFDHLPKASDV